ncbi:OTU-like cysteine protease domain-containing protein, putative [Eimeria tenella]|uniref:OTU-like cysteine protease domain-containing protein, putative n=1 Tax=Eimeria tenella TaxID=5802 RepID=U6KXR6_EIMTE|nr:OTU-like cysteine protease domain-containing protein, putative [Eimeria tenella]CDJ40290.1 OTU-like cysteine protease domain-containing protein, putative [Eimeria tenella]|eukprot:XP_013231043.1 OTU-like cysteine protease domain-containing protein, putative [Eimeria tenella]
MGKKKQKGSFSLGRSGEGSGAGPDDGEWGRSGDLRGPSRGSRGNRKPRGPPVASDMSFSAALKAAGLSLRHIVPDGNCLFRAAADQLYGQQAQHRAVRAAAVSYMSSHESSFSGFIDTEEEPFNRYLKRMATDGTWGGQLELQAISLAYKVNLLIYVAPEDGWGEGGGAHRSGKAKTGASAAARRERGAADAAQDDGGAPKWDIWKMQNFGPSAVCLQLAFHPDMQHYNSLRMQGAPEGAPSTLTLQQLQAHSDSWEGQGEEGVPQENSEVSTKEGPPMEPTLQSNKAAALQEPAANEPSATINSSSCSSSRYVGLPPDKMLGALRAVASLTNMGPLCPACAACCRAAWRRGALTAQLNSWGPLGRPSLFRYVPLAAEAAQKVGEKPVKSLQSAARLRTNYSLRHRGRSCLAAIWPRRRQRVATSTDSRSSTSSTDSSSESSKAESEGVNGDGRDAAKDGASHLNVLVAVLQPPPGSSNTSEVYLHRNLIDSGSGSTGSAGAALDGLFSIDSISLRLHNCTNPPPAAPAVPAESAAASPSPRRRRAPLTTTAAAAAEALGSAHARPLPPAAVAGAPATPEDLSQPATGGIDGAEPVQRAAATTAEATAADATAEATRAKGAGAVVAAKEVLLPCRVWAGPTLLRIERPPLLQPSNASSSNGTNNSIKGTGSSRRAVSLPSLRIRLLPCARLWLTGEAAAAATAAATGSPCFKVTTTGTGGEVSVVEVEAGPDAAAAVAASAAAGAAVARGGESGAADAKAESSTQQQEKQQQLQQLQQVAKKGRMTKKERAELKKAKKLQRELFRAERRRTAACDSGKDAVPQRSSEGDPAGGEASLQNLAELTRRLLTV